ncbi:PAS domain S-box-containing protein [Syntrophus gentianae]|uniref:histidine kinase n=1 Tax=Syntrophus gentianae TaxID=43775 RepID=A0A1H8AHW0_9BACT|nr:ATP-binding protein [Syntrophus gentianae]SEM69418.1 PAS domain S-box-containing protein [Syntrophus gentianae]
MEIKQTPARHTSRLHFSETVFRILLALAALAVISGFTWLAALRADRELRTDLLPQVCMIAASVNPQRVALLSGTKADLASPDYQRIKEQLTRIRLSNPKCRFLYLMSRRSDGTIILHVDSEPVQSKDYSPPGQVYSEAPEELHSVFATGKATVRGPYSDRWGTWVSAFVPLPDTGTSGGQTVFGMDIAAADWIGTVALRATLPAALAALVALLALFAASLYRSRRDLRDRQEELRQTEATLRCIFKATPVGLSTVKDHVIQSVNKAWCNSFGYSESEIIGQDSRMIFENKAEYERVGRELYSDLTKRGIASVQTRHRRKDGILRDVILTAAPLSLDTLSLEAVVAVEDITERKHLEERLRRAEKMEALGTLAGGVAHDLNNVLGVMVGYSELLLEMLTQGNPLRKYADYILQSSMKGAAIIQDLLTMARRGVIVSEVVNLNKVISDYFKSPEFEKMIAYHPCVKISTNLEEGLLNLKGSPVHLGKMIMNLVSNAAEAISGPGKVVIRTENRHLEEPICGYEEMQEGDYLVLTVSDTGNGISAEDLSKIFEPFYTKKVMGRSGTGLGLPMVWGTVKDHRGHIDVQSEEGKGSRFILYFPVTREEPAKIEETASPLSYRGKGEFILVVDDVREQRELAMNMLRNLGYRVEAVAGGEEAIEYLRKKNADLVLLDMIMNPGIDGMETYRRILEIHPGQKAVIVSGYSETDRARKAQDMGAGAFVRKPYILEKIGLAIRQELDRIS